MKFRRGGHLAIYYVITCNSNPIEFVSKFTYLGVVFQTKGKLTGHFDHLRNTGIADCACACACDFLAEVLGRLINACFGVSKYCSISSLKAAIGWRKASAFHLSTSTEPKCSLDPLLPVPLHLPAHSRRNMGLRYSNGLHHFWCCTPSCYTINNACTCRLCGERQPTKFHYLMGYFNIDILKVNIHAKTNEFVNDVISQGFLPKITRPTRITPHSATLIDHIYSNDNRPTFQNNISGIIITDVADHFGTFHIVSKCKQTPVQTYSKIRQMKTDNILKFNNILANEYYTSVLLADCPNYAYHNFMEIYTNAFNRACPIKSIKTPKNIFFIIKREPWVTNDILTSSLTKSKLLKRKLKKPTEHNINAFKKYCMVFDKVKKMAKESYFNSEL